MSDTALLVVDLQPALMTGGYEIDECLSRIADLADRARAADVPVVYMRQRLPAEVPADLADFHPAVTPKEGDIVLEKDSADSFLDTTLDDLLREQSVRRVAVTGYATDFCVDSTARGALSRGYDLVLVADGHSTAERPPDHPPTAPQVIAHHNMIFTIIQYPGRSIEVAPAEEVRFDAPAN